MFIQIIPKKWLDDHPEFFSNLSWQTICFVAEHKEAASNGTGEGQKDNGEAVDEMTMAAIPKVKVESVEEHKKQSCLSEFQFKCVYGIIFVKGKVCCYNTDYQGINPQIWFKVIIKY